MRRSVCLRIFPVLAAVFALLLSGCGNSDGNEVPEAAELNGNSIVEIAGRKDISYYVTEVFCDGAAVKIENNSDSVLYLGSAVSVERNIGGEWQELPSEGAGRIWETNPTGFVKSESSGTEIWHWENYYGDLPVGDYRIIREAFFDDKNSFGSIALAAEFSVEASVRSVYDYENERWEKENEVYLQAIDAASAEAGEKSSREISVRNDVSFSVTKVLEKGVETYVENNGEMTLYFGAGFSVEKKVGGEWYTLIPIELPEGFGFAFHDILYGIEPGDTRTEESGWAWYYGSLEPGDYRIIREFYFDDRSTFPDRMTLAAEFEIVSNSSAEIGEKSTIKISERDDVSFLVTEVSPEYVITKLENDSGQDLYWDSEFSVEKKIGGEWYTLVSIELPEGGGNHARTMERPSARSGGAETVKAGWDLLYGKLTEGHYRIIKKFHTDDIGQIPEYMTLAAEFEILPDSTAEIGEKSRLEISETDAVSFYVTKTYTNAAEVCIENHTDAEVYYGDPFWVEKKIGGEWYELKPMEEFGWFMPRHTLKAGETITFEPYWGEYYYGILPPGDYRIIKELDYYDGESSYVYVYLAAEFSVGAEDEAKRIPPSVPEEEGLAETTLA